MGGVFFVIFINEACLKGGSRCFDGFICLSLMDLVGSVCLGCGFVCGLMF